MDEREKQTCLDLEVSVAKSLFMGQIVEENLFPFPNLSSDESQTVRIVLESIDKFMEGQAEHFREYDEAGHQPEAYVNSLRELGLFGILIPEQFGGIGLSNSAYARILQQTSRHDASTSLTIGAHTSIGMKGLLLYGSDEQKEKYLPRLATGEMIAAFCLTEANAGSDAASLKSFAKKNTDGSWILNGEKIWITNGPIADFFTVFARTDSENAHLSAFIVEREWDGVTTGAKEQKMGIRASGTCSVHFDNVKVPAECLLGEEGKGFKIAMGILNNGRTGLGGGSIGGMKACIKLAARTATERKQFGRCISEFGLIKEKIALMTVNCFAAESLVGMLGYYIDNGSKDFSIEAAISKVFCSDTLWATANEALQVAGGNGFMKEFPYERMVRDSRINMIYEGTNEILRLYIALSGMKDAGVYLNDLAASLKNIFNEPIESFGVLGDYATKKFTHLTSLGRDRIECVPSVLQDDAAIYESYTVQLARATEAILRRHGKKVIEKQLVMKRMANVVIDLFVGLCVLSRVSKLVEEKSAEKCKQELAISHIFALQAKVRMAQNLPGSNREEDELIKALSDHIVENEGYHWDTL